MIALPPSWLACIALVAFAVGCRRYVVDAALGCVCVCLLALVFVASWLDDRRHARDGKASRWDPARRAR